MSYESCVRLVLALCLLLAAIGLVGCERDAVPPLVEVTELAPRAVESGDRVEIRGAGFPQGRPARVVFDGVVHRAGEGDASVSIDVDGVVATTERVEVAVREAFEERFCGRGDRAAHATFEGSVEVAFASRQAGAPPLVGVLRGVTLDVRPSSVRADVLAERAEEGARVLAFLGIRPGIVSARGLPIEEIRRGSLADSAGLVAGDFLVAIDGVRAFGLEDVLPASSRAVRLTVRHAEEGTEETTTVSMTGYAGRRIPRELEPAIVLVALALAALLLLVVPGPALLTRLEIGLAARLRSRPLGALVRGSLGRRGDLAVTVLTTAALATFALGPHVFGPDVDGIVLVVAAASLLVASRPAEAPGVWASIRNAAEVALVTAAMVIAVLELAVADGAVSLAELVRAQGAAPWEAAAAKNPAALVVGLAYLGALVALLRARSRTTRARLLERAGVLCACAVAAAAFLGGWQLPVGLDTRAAWVRGAGALVFVAKTWGLAAVVWSIASLAGEQAIADARRFVVRRVVPALAGAAVLFAIERRLAPSAAVERAIGAAAFAAAVLLALRSLGRIRMALARREPHASPFI